MQDIPLKLSSPLDSLEVMKLKHPIARRTWRDRFVEIARQSGEIDVRSGAALASGLRPRARMAGFATLRRGQTR